MLNRLLGILPNASEHGPLVDHMLEACHWFMLALFVGWITYFFIAIFRFHKSRNPKADYHGVRSHASTHIEFSVVLIEAVLLLGFALPLWGRRVNDIPQTGERLEVRCIAYQFGWFFHYPGTDGKFGRQNLRFISGSNPLGIDANDENGKDDFVTSELHLINHMATVLRVSSRDVIHGLALQQMRIQQDAMPGMEIPQWFRPIKTGTWELICAQLCGQNHYTMRTTYTVEEKKEFYDVFVKEALDLKAANAANSAAAAPAAPAAEGKHSAPEPK